MSDLFERLGECPRGGEPERFREILRRVFAAILGAGPVDRGLGGGPTMGDPQRRAPAVTLSNARSPLPWALRETERYLGALDGEVELVRVCLDVLATRPVAERRDDDAR